MDMRSVKCWSPVRESLSVIGDFATVGLIALGGVDLNAQRLWSHGFRGGPNTHANLSV